MTERTMTKADLVTSMLLIVFAAAITLISLSMPDMSDQNRNPLSAPGIVPGFIGVVLFLLGLSMLVRSIRRGAPGFFAQDRGSKPDAGTRASWARIARTVGLCLVYVALLGRVWFPLLTFLFVFAFVTMFEYDPKIPIIGQWKTPLFAAILALPTAALVFLVFQYLFLVNLP